MGGTRTALAAAEGWEMTTFRCLRGVIKGFLGVGCTGCPCPRIPHDLPPLPAVWTSFPERQDDGRLDRLHDGLRDGVKQQGGRHPQDHCCCNRLGQFCDNACEERGYAEIRITWARFTFDGSI